MSDYNSRPTRMKKTWVDEFPVSVHIADDERVHQIEGKYGIIAFAVLIKLFCKIYGDKGYYMEFKERDAAVCATRFNIPLVVLLEIVSDCLHIGVFNKPKYDEYKILTSAGIQKRYMYLTERRLNVCILPEHSLLNKSEITEIKQIKRPRKDKSEREYELKSDPIRPQDIVSPFGRRLAAALSKCNPAHITMTHTELHAVTPIWERLYASVNIEQEMGHAEQWLIVNKQTRTNSVKYLGNWFRRALNRVRDYRPMPDRAIDANKYSFEKQSNGGTNGETNR